MSDTTTTDPLGRKITLHELTWTRHILRGHPDMAPHRVRAESAIRKPELICYSSSDTDVRLYYDPKDGSNLMVCVVADVVAGFVKTAYRSRKVKAGAQEWPVSTSSKDS